MPTVNFFIRWPSGEKEQCYSPSTIIHDYFKVGDVMPVNDFMSAATQALQHASDRVEERFGYACSSAKDQLRRLEEKSVSFSENTGKVTILSMKDG